MQLAINIKDKTKEQYVISWLLQHKYIELSIPKYKKLDFLSPQQNEELKRRLKSFENNEMNFISIEQFKEKYENYV